VNRQEALAHFLEATLALEEAVHDYRRSPIAALGSLAAAQEHLATLADVARRNRTPYEPLLTRLVANLEAAVRLFQEQQPRAVGFYCGAALLEIEAFLRAVSRSMEGDSREV
jgi:hypothetical protein